MNVHVVLGAGGVRTLSYLGALSELQKNGVEIQSISACSAGSLVGACVSSGTPLSEIEARVKGIDLSRYFGVRKSPWSGITGPLHWPFAEYDEPRTAEFFQQILEHDFKFSELVIPFSAIAIDLTTARILVYSKETTPEMPLSEAVKVATAAPPLFPPQVRHRRTLVDGVLASECPVWLALEHPDEFPIVALTPRKPSVNLRKQGLPTFLRKAFEIAGTSRDLYLTDQMLRVQRIEIDCEDIAVDQFQLSPDEKNDLFEKGRKAVLDHLSSIRMLGAASPELLVRPPIPSEASDDDRAEWGAYRIISRANSRMSRQVRNQVFLSYAHSNGTAMRDRLMTVLAPLREKYKIVVWEDSQIAGGAKWREEIKAALEATKVAVLLVTPEYLASDFIKTIEMTTFLNSGDVQILWVSTVPSLWRETALESVQCANEADRPLSILPEPELELQLTSIAKQIKAALGL